jgi:hypothetical protein
MQNIPSSELTQEQRLTVQKWFDEKMAGGVIGKCGMCGSRSWTLVEHLVAPPTWNSGGGMLIGGISFPALCISYRKRLLEFNGIMRDKAGWQNHPFFMRFKINIAT